MHRSSSFFDSDPPRKREVYLPTLYKKRGLPKTSKVCAICVDRTKGACVEVRLTHGVRLHLCEGHASEEFMRQRAGRDFVLTLTRLWASHQCLTRRRSKALDAHLEALSRPAKKVALPGSYAWPELRREVEEAARKGSPFVAILTSVARWCAKHAPGARAPHRRTIRRWIAQQRWFSRPLERPESSPPEAPEPPPEEPRPAFAGNELSRKIDASVQAFRAEVKAKEEAQRRKWLGHDDTNR